MLPKLKKCRRGVSPIIATIMLLALTLGAAGMIAGVIFNINVIELPDYLESPLDSTSDLIKYFLEKFSKYWCITS